MAPNFLAWTLHPIPPSLVIPSSEVFYILTTREVGVVMVVVEGDTKRCCR